MEKEMVFLRGKSPIHLKSIGMTSIDFAYVALPSHSNEAWLEPKEQLIPTKPQRDLLGQLLRAAVTPFAYVAALFIVLTGIDK